MKDNLEVSVQPDGDSSIMLRDDPVQLKDVIPQWETPWYHRKHMLQLNLFLFGAILSQVISGFDASSTNSLQSIPSFQSYFHQPSGPVLSTMTNGLAIGTLITVPFAMVIIDYFGRKKTILLGCGFVIAGAAIQAASQNFGMFTAARILLGIGLCLNSASSQPLLAETAFPTQRAAITALLLALWPLGSFVAAMVTWGPYRTAMRYNDWSWRLPSLLQAAFPFLQIILVGLGPESPRWLINKGREDQARAVFVKYHAGGDEDSALVAFEMAEIKAIIDQERQNQGRKYTEWFRSRQRLRRLFIVLAVPAMVQLCGNALISYYLPIVLGTVGITDSNDQLLINIGLTLYGLVGAVVVGLYVERFPRKVMFITGFGLMCVTYVTWTVLSAINQQTGFENHGLSTGVVTMIYLFLGFYHIVSPVAGTYTMEVCPYHLRAQGATLYQLSGNVVGFFNNYVNNVAMDAIQWRYYIVWCIWLVVQMNVVYWVFPETRGLGLEEVAQVFGEDVTAGYEAGEKAVGQVDEYRDEGRRSTSH